MSFLPLVLCLAFSAASAEQVNEPEFIKLENGMLQPVLPLSGLRDEDYTSGDYAPYGKKWIMQWTRKPYRLPGEEQVYPVANPDGLGPLPRLPGCAV